MITIYDSADMAHILSGPIDHNLKAILLGRLELLAEFSDWDIADLAHFLIVEPGDCIEAIARELGVNPLINIVDDACFPDKSFQPSFEFCISRKGSFDLTFALSDSGQALVLLVPNQEGVEPTLLELCRAYATL